MIPTARGDDAEYVARFHAAFGELGASTQHLPFFHRTPDLRSLLVAQDAIFVGGGNTKSMLAVWREWQLPQLLKEAYESGVVVGGQSAGAICWFEQGVTDSWADRLRPLDCMGFLPGSCCPHYDGEAERRPAYHAPDAARCHQAGLRHRRCSGRALQERTARARSVEESWRESVTSSRSTAGTIREDALDVTQLAPR